MGARLRGRDGRAPTTLQDAAVAEMVAALDSPDFPRVALRALSRLVSSDAAALFIYAVDELVYLAADDLLPLVDARFLSNYSRGTYRFSPFFQHHRAGLASGIYAMGHLARAPNIRKPVTGTAALELDAGEEVGYRTSGWPRRLAEIDVAVALAPGRTVQIALYRGDGDRFAAQDIAALAGVNKTVSALCSRYWRNAELSRDSLDGMIADALQSLAHGRLSAREAEAVALGLGGLETRALADRLGISEETVKTHRKRAYGKLGTRSQAELYRALLRLLVRAP